MYWVVWVQALIGVTVMHSWVTLGVVVRWTSIPSGSCVLNTSMVEYLLILLIDTLDQHLDQYAIDVLMDSRSTLYQHLFNSWSIVSQVSTNSYESIKN